MSAPGTIGPATQASDFIRSWYRYWRERTAAPSYEVADHEDRTLRADEIDIVFRTLTPQERSYYHVQRVFFASGLPRQAFCDSANDLHLWQHSQGWYIPKIHGRGIPESYHSKPRADKETTNERWREAEEIRDGMFKQPGANGQHLLTWYCSPRTVQLWTDARFAKNSIQSMEHWRKDGNFTMLHGCHGATALFTQLAGNCQIPVERSLGSPQTPDFSLFHVSLPGESILVCYTIVRQADGPARAWKAGDDIPFLPLPLTTSAVSADTFAQPPTQRQHRSQQVPLAIAPSTQRHSFHPTLEPPLNTTQPAFRQNTDPEHYRLRSSGPADEQHHSLHFHSLSHRQRFIYGYGLTTGVPRQRRGL